MNEITFKFSDGKMKQTVSATNDEVMIAAATLISNIIEDMQNQLIKYEDARDLTMKLVMEAAEELFESKIMEDVSNE